MFLSLGLMFLGSGFASDVSKFRVRAFLGCFPSLGFMFLGFLSLGCFLS